MKISPPDERGVTAFRSLLAVSHADTYNVDFCDLRPEQLPDHDVLVRVAYSSLNYKDGLAIGAKGKIVRRFPMVLGIDLAGTVISSRCPQFKPGERVLAIGQGLGETEWGGYSQFARVRPDWLTLVPEPFDLEQVMAIGTAGFTAMLCVMALERVGVEPASGEVLVTGAAGGVGSFATLLLARAGYQVVASTGRIESHGYLHALGALGVVPRSELEIAGAPLQPQRWAGAIDTVGGKILANVISQTRYDGAVAACGMAHATDLAVSIFPFILRNVALLGTSSSNTQVSQRARTWSRLARELPVAAIEKLYRVEPMSRLVDLAAQIVAGRVQGRVVVDVNS